MKNKRQNVTQFALNLMCSSIILFFVNTANSQKATDRSINIDCNNKNFVRILYEIERSQNIKFYFDPQRIPYFVYNKSYKNKQVWYILQDLLSGALLKVISIDQNTIGLIPANQVNKTYIEDLVLKWKSGVYSYPFKEEVLIKKITTLKPENAAKETKIEFKLLDEDDQSPIIGGQVFSDDYAVVGLSNENGIFEFKVKPGINNLNLSYIGYQAIRIELAAFKDTSMTLFMLKSPLLLEEVEISAAKMATDKLEMSIGVESIEMKKLESLTQAMGEKDIIKSLEILPGIKSMAEVSSGFNVRGGNIDENQVLLNDAVIFNPTHVLGFTSAFNADAVQSVTLSKAYIDAQYGGWNSSVLDIRTSYGNADKWKGTGAVGTAIGKLTVDGPVGKSATILISSRKSYSDWMLNQARNKEISNSSASFYDYNLAVKVNLSSKHFVTADHFRSYDNFNYNQQIGYQWTNTVAGLSFVNLWNKKWTSKLNFSISNYSSIQSGFSEPVTYNLSSGIKIMKGSLGFNYKNDENFSFKGGIVLIRSQLLPEQIEGTKKNTVVSNFQVQRNGNLAISPYLAAIWNLNKKLKFEGGLRFSQYFIIGNRKEFIYKNDGFYDKTNIIDTLLTSNTGFLAGLMEPRFNVVYKIFSSFSFKMAYTKTSQNLHLLVNANTSLPSDIWIPSGRNIRPRFSDQYSTGFTYVNGDGKINFSSEFYYKTYLNNIILKNFPELTQNEHIETEILQGVGKSYGAEFSLEVKTGKLSANLAYTYAKTYQKNTNQFSQIRNNEYFVSDNDIPHQLNILLNYKSNAVLSFNSGFIFKNGRPVTLPQGVVSVDGFLIPLYSDRNLYRIPDYIRLDVGMTIDFKKVRNTGMRHSFSLGIYNVLGRKNALNIFYRKSEIGNVKGYKLSLIGTAIPSLSWNFIF